MRIFGNIIWYFPFLGFIPALLMFALGALLSITVIAAPVGLGLMEMGKFYLAPFTRQMVPGSKLPAGEDSKAGLWKRYSTLVMILWLPFGALLAVLLVLDVIAMFISILGIPAGIVIAKSIGTVFNPVGKKCVSKDVADAIRIKEAQAQLGQA